MSRDAGTGSLLPELRPSTPGSPLATFFAIASRDETWTRGRIVESRLMHGTARQSGNTIDAVDEGDEDLVRQCDRALEEARAAVSALGAAQVRVHIRATRENEEEAVETTITVAVGGLSIVTTPGDAHRDYELLTGLSGPRPATVRGPLPIVWQNGTAAVLLHEAIGHAREHGAPEALWPSWLSVEAPIAWRRATFRDVPLPRMTHLIARQSGAPFAPPGERIEVQLIDGGNFDPLTDTVTIDVAVSSAGPFTIRRKRAEIAAALIGASGEPLRYPGVICSREGQRLYVASYAPIMLSDALQ